MIGNVTLVPAPVSAPSEKDDEESDSQESGADPDDDSFESVAHDAQDRLTLGS